MIRVLGPQGAVSSVKLNVPVAVPDGQGNLLSHVYDLARGKYDLTVETGPSFTTRREEAASQMTELIRAYPAAAPVLGDLLAKNLDWPDADEIATATRVATQQLNRRARPWVWGRPPRPPRHHRRVFVYRL